MKRAILSFFHVRLQCGMLCACLLGAFPACKKMIRIDPPVNAITSPAVFQNEATAQSAVNGMYSSLMIDNLSFSNGGTSVFGALSADELLPTTPSATLQAFANNALNSKDQSLRSRFWLQAYTSIYQANALLEGLRAKDNNTFPAKNALMGEAFFIRAFCYFYLVNLFGDVPMVLSTDYRINAALPRAQATAVYQQILKDLDSAQGALPEHYITADRSRPNKWAAAALRARVHLFLQDWSLAEQDAATVIQSGYFNLAPEPENVFEVGSPETIWQLYPVLPDFNSAEGNAFLPYAPTVQPTYVLRDDLLDAFEAGDQRKSAWVHYTTINNLEYAFPYKYKVWMDPAKKEYNVVLRLAELYLIRGEARAQQGKIEAAVEDLNVLRGRAHVPEVQLQSKGALLAAFEQERRVELFTEWGHRWLDLKRTGRIDAVLETIKGGWAPYKALYPIPFAELLYNPALVQNPGY